MGEPIEDAATAKLSRTFRVGDRVYQRAGRPYIMGILNVTPDSFSDGGRYFALEKALNRAYKMAAEGADFIDVGGESTRPGSDVVFEEEELRRVLPVIEKLAKEIRIPLSIDTTKSGVARRALQSGAQIVNDISALRADPEMIAVASDFKATVVLMHMQGEPRTMQHRPQYDDVICEILAFLKERTAVARAGGVDADRILIDPGIGFGKRLGDNYEILRRLREFAVLGPVLIGPSRKSFIGNVLHLPPEERLFGTAAAVAVAVMNGADILRVHDVKEMVQVTEIAHQCLTRAEPRA